MPFALGLQDNIIVVPGQSAFIGDFQAVDGYLMTPSPERIGPAELRVEVGCIGRCFIEPLIVNIEVLPVRAVAFIDQFNNGTFSKGHPDITIQSASLIKAIVHRRRRTEQQRLITIDNPMSQTEKIPERDKDTGAFSVAYKVLHLLGLV